ncbi:MAG: ATP-binding protein [Bacteroidales bacterium]|nr:ATP-binding protein [Candidatus Scybalocola fimicaballi]
MSTENNTKIQAALEKYSDSEKLSKTFAFAMQRRFLDDNRYSLNIINDAIDTSDRPVFWIKLSQFGTISSDNEEFIFSAMQKILTAVNNPKLMELLFLTQYTNNIYNMYIGIRCVKGCSKSKEIEEFRDRYCDFIKTIIPGVECHSCEKKDLTLNFEKYFSVNTITGIPSIDEQNKIKCPTSIDKLMNGMIGSEFNGYSYLVVATPMPLSYIEELQYQCRSLAGISESLSSIQLSRSISCSESDTKTDSEANNKSDNWNVQVGFQGSGFSYGESSSKSFTKAISRSIQNGTTENTVMQAVNKNLKSVTDQLDKFEKRLDLGKSIGLWKTQVFLFGERKDTTIAASLQLKSVLSGESSYLDPIRSITINTDDPNFSYSNFNKFRIPLFRSCYNQDNIKDNDLHHPLNDDYLEACTYINTKELAHYINFPLHSVPGISVVESIPEFSLSETKYETSHIDFGNILNGGSYTKLNYQIPVTELSKHALVCGINGTGKTNTLFSILESIGDTPFLIIEPAKTEYVEWACEYNRTHKDNQISIYIPGRESYTCSSTGDNVKLNNLQINPFEVIWLNKDHKPDILAHIDRLKSIFASAFPVQDILPVLLEELIFDTYSKFPTYTRENWLNTDNFPNMLSAFPTLENMQARCESFNFGYNAEIERNMKGCLLNRIKNLRRGWKGKMLDVKTSADPLKWRNLFSKPCVINLSAVSDDQDKSFFMSLLLQFLYEYHLMRAELGKVNFNSNSCEHITVIEEAHRVMMKNEDPTSPQHKTAQIFSNMLSEIRAYGEGLILVDQVPTRLVPDAIKNTNIKIIHRLAAKDDVDAVADTMSLSDRQRSVIPKLLVGQCIVGTSLNAEKHLVKVNKKK